MVQFENALIAIVSVAVVLGIMVLIHEWGHYIVAKSLGVTVKVFSVGFGKRIWGVEKNGTDYRISALPFGGYVKMAGDNPMEPTTDDPGEFLNHPRWHRFLIAIAGPAVNIAFAILLLFCVYKFHYERPVGEGKAPVVGAVEPGSPAEQAGLEPGDRILGIAGKDSPDWDTIKTTIALSPNQPVALTVDRNGQQKTVTFSPKLQQPDQVGTVDFEPAQPLLVSTLKPGSPAQRAGVAKGDTIEAINGKRVYSVFGLRKTLADAGGHAVQVTVLHQGETRNVQITPERAVAENGKEIYMLGFTPTSPYEVVRLPFTTSVAKSVQTNVASAGLILELVKKMLQHKVSIKAMSGPVGMAQMSGQVARLPGWTPKFEFMALISINLGVMNLLPIPILDGGVILLLFVEGLMRRDISITVKERIYQASFVFLVLFAAIVMFNDIVKMR